MIDATCIRQEKEDCQNKEHWISLYGQHPLSPLLYNQNIRFFFSVGVEDGCLGYFIHKKVFFAVGGLLCAAEKKTALLDEWLDWVNRQGGISVFLHASPEDYHLIADRGYYVNQIGTGYSIDLRDYSLSGKRFQQLRNKVNKSRKAGVTVRMINSRDDFHSVLPQLEEINREWLEEKNTKLLKYLVTDFTGILIPSQRYRLLVAERHDQVLAYIVYSRVLSGRPGWFHDLSRKRSQTPSGVMQAINVTALDIIEQSKSENEHWLHFGFTPLADILDTDYTMGKQQSLVFSAVVKTLARYNGVVYPASTQRQYKMSWRPQSIEPEYFAYPKGKALRALWGLLRATNSL